MKKLIVLFILCCMAGSVPAQSRLGIYIGGGTDWYLGDMNDRILTHRKLFGVYGNAGLLYRLSPRFDIAANFMMGSLEGADSLAIQDFNKRRNLHFSSDIWEGSLLLNYRFLGMNGSRTRRVNPYLIAGVGYFHFNPVAEYNGESVELQPLGTEGQYIAEDTYPDPYELNQFSVPAGIGIEFRISPSFAARLELMNHFTFTDYLDDVSGTYADSIQLAGTTNGSLAVALASNLVTGYPRRGAGRGDPKDNDSFFTLGISLLYTPNFGGNGNYGPGKAANSGSKKKKKKAACPTYQ